MGTRADFYVGRDDKAEWIGSTAYDGYPSDEEERERGTSWSILSCTDEDEFRRHVADMIANRNDGTAPEQGWPWPWETSATTDYAYAFEDGKVWASRFGGPWWLAAEPEPGKDALVGVVAPARHPDMSARKAVTYGPRSGALFFRVPK